MSAPLVQATGRRKRSVARVRLRTGAGTITINGRTAEDYFPSQTHRMQIVEPLTATATEGRYDVDATIHGGGSSGQAGALRLGISRGTGRGGARAARHAQEGRLPHSRPAQEGSEEVRPQEGTQGTAVQQALSAGRRSDVPWARPGLPMPVRDDPARERS